MARDIQQPQRQVFAPRQTRIAHVPAQETSASGTTKNQDFGRILGGLGQLAGTYAQEKVRQQREIDTTDRHRFMANKAKYIPEIMQQIEENNLQGAPADEVFAFARGTEAYRKLYAGFQDEDNLKLLQEDQDSRLLGQFTNWQTDYEEQQRQEMFAGALTTGFAEANPESYGSLIQEFQSDALHPEGPYKMRPEEFNRQVVALAQAYNQAGQFDKAQALTENLEFDDGSAPGANLQLETAKAGIEKQRMEVLKKAWGNAFYGLHNDPELTPEVARGAVDQAASEGLLQTARDREAMYDWLISGGRSSAQNQLMVLTQDQGARSARTLEGLDNYLRRRSAREAIPEKVRDQAREQLIGQKLETAQSQYLEAAEAYQADPNDPEALDIAQDSQRSYHEALRFAPPQVQSQLMDLANLPVDKDGYPPEGIEETYGRLMDDLNGAFGGNMAEALKTYFPGDSQKSTRMRLLQMSLLKDTYGGWELGFKKAYESRSEGPEGRHYSWDEQEVFRNLQNQFAAKHGVEKLPEYITAMELMRGAPIESAHDVVTQAIEQDYTYIVDRDARPAMLQGLMPWREAQEVSDSYRLSGKNGREFARIFADAVDQNFGARPMPQRGQAGALGGKTIDGTNYHFEVIAEYIQDMLPEYEELTGLDLSIVDAEDAFTSDNGVIVEANPFYPDSIQLKLPNGLVIAPRVTINDLIEAHRVRNQERPPQAQSETPQPDTVFYDDGAGGTPVPLDVEKPAPGMTETTSRNLDRLRHHRY